jgi:hypothetical protein
MGEGGKDIPKDTTKLFPSTPNLSGSFKSSTKPLQLKDVSSGSQTPTTPPTVVKPTLHAAIAKLIGSISATSFPQPYFLPPGVGDATVVIYEEEPSSIISPDYERKFHPLWQLPKENTLTPDPTVSSLQGFPISIVSDDFQRLSARRICCASKKATLQRVQIRRLFL